MSVHASSAVVRPPGRVGRAALLVLSLLLVSLVSIVGASTTDTSRDSWYRSLDQAPWNPPDWVFAPVWTVLYVLMAIAAWLVARNGLGRRDVRVALAVYLVQLAANLAWTLLFFGLEAPGLALVDIVALAVLVGATILVFAPIARAAAMLLVPYLAWVVFAATLNLWIVAAN